MPLVKGNSSYAIGKNVRREMGAGYPQKQAIAIAESEAGNSRPKAFEQKKSSYSGMLKGK